MNITTTCIKYLFFLLYIFASVSLEGQTILGKKVNFSISEMSIPDALSELIIRAGVNISFSPAFFDPAEKVSVESGYYNIKSILEIILKDTGIDFRVWEDNILLYRRENQYFTICGYVRDSETGEALPWTTVFHAISGKGVLANAYGYYCIKLPEGEQLLRFSNVGYEKLEVLVKVKKAEKLDADMRPSITWAAAVLVSSPVEKTVHEAPNQQNILASRLAIFTAPGGEPDLLRMVQALPGVQSGADGFGGLHIRGGNADQNLILLDDVPVFNPSHSAGLFSIFNTSLVKSAVLTKGGFPARYGGRLSSVLEIRTREGSLEKSSAAVGAGFLATSVYVETPVIKDRAALIIGGRRSHLDRFFKKRSRENKIGENKTGEAIYHFFDGNAKLNAQLSKNDRIYLSYYTGGDRFKDFAETGDTFNEHTSEIKRISYDYDWGNRITSLRWNHLFSKRLFSNTTLFSSKFNYNSKIEDSENIYIEKKLSFSTLERVQFSSDITESGLRSDFDFFLNDKHRLKWGTGVIHRVFVPSILNSVMEENFIDSMQTFTTPLTLDSVDYTGTEAYAYFSDGWKSEKWEVNGGLHAAWFKAGKFTNFSLEPRLSIRYFILKKTAISAATSRMTQFLHLLTTTDAGLPNDLWVPATAHAKPENAWQTTAGFHQKIGESWLLNTEFYWKKMSGLLSYTDSVLHTMSTQSVDASSWEELAVSGTGKSTGWEVLLEKNKGKLIGWASYTLSKTERNFNHKLPYRFDSRHVFHLVLAYHLSDWLEANAGWSFQSGLPARDFEQLRKNFIFSDIFETSTAKVENSRLPAYHRLDVGLSANFRTGKISHQLSLGVYNLYNRKNAFLAYPTANKKEWIKINALPLLPGVRWVARIK